MRQILSESSRLPLRQCGQLPFLGSHVLLHRLGPRAIDRPVGGLLQLPIQHLHQVFRSALDLATIAHAVDGAGPLLHGDTPASWHPIARRISEEAPRFLTTRESIGPAPVLFSRRFHPHLLRMLGSNGGETRLHAFRRYSIGQDRLRSLPPTSASGSRFGTGFVSPGYGDVRRSAHARATARPVLPGSYASRR